MKIPKLPKLKVYLISIGGGDNELLSERAKNHESLFLGLGSIILLVAIVAACSAIFATHAIFENFGHLYLPSIISDASPFIAIFAGLIYGLLIFSIDRILIATCPSLDEIKENGIKSKIFFVALIFLRLMIAIVMAHQITILLGISLSQIEIYEDVKTSWIERHLDLQQKTDDQWQRSITAETQQLEANVQAMYAASSQLTTPQAASAASAASLSSPLTPPRKMIDYSARAEVINKSIQRLMGQPDSPQKRELLKIHNEQLQEIRRFMKYDSDDAAHSNDINSYEKKKAMILAQISTEAFLTLEFYKTKVENSRNHIIELTRKYNDWVLEKKTVSSLGDEFDKCTFGKAGCDIPSVGILTKVATFKSMEHKPGGADKFYLIELLKYFLIFIELIALIIKVMADKKDYATELNKKIVGDRKTQDFKDQLRDSLTKIEAINDTTKKIVSSTYENIEHYVGTSAKSSQIITDANVQATMFNLLRNLGSLRVIKKWLSANDNQIASAAGVENNYEFTSNPKTSHGLAPFYEEIPSAENLQHNIKGNIRSSIVRAIISGIIVAIIYAAVAYTDPTQVTFSAVTMFLTGVAATLMVGSISMLTTSPGFSMAAKSGMWIAISIIILGGAIYFSSELINTASLPPETQKVTSLLGGTAKDILLYSTFMLLVLFLFNAAKKHLKMEKTPLDSEKKENSN
jgi:hypothetical protein